MLVFSTWKLCLSPLIYFLIIITFTTNVQCRCQALCMYDSWMDWNCTCSNSTQKRERNMCCPLGPKTREECASLCNITLYWQEEAPCDKCNNGGIYDYKLKKCKCPPTHKGTYCCEQVKCSENPCKHGTCNDTVSPFICECDPGFKGTVCDKVFKRLPPWLPYLEYSIISVVGIVLLIGISYVCSKYCVFEKLKKQQNQHGTPNKRQRIKENRILPNSLNF